MTTPCDNSGVTHARRPAYAHLSTDGDSLPLCGPCVIASVAESVIEGPASEFTVTPVDQ